MAMLGIRIYVTGLYPEWRPQRDHSFAAEEVLSRLAPDRRSWQHGVILRRIAAGWDDGD